ncbi:MAG TPA: thiamine pyrophosphate-dependent dehydrogenase E1 component subunit alpha [Alphaproteobacteria bacterium]|nr:thiamine pyrophosphate-dependent dehydrogenase E1 component subunit alpha [Alphaproteobacteria bacterium]
MSLSAVRPVAAESAAVAATRAQLEGLYRRMALIRAVEETLLRLFAEGKLRGTVHTCLGQEAIAVGVVSALDPARDTICSNHRGHGHYLAYCGDVEGLIAEIMGKPAGICGGIGGSQHLHRGNFYANGILGGMSPVATGIALAERLKGSGAVSVVFHGDGALGEGAIYESFNIAALWKLPVLWAIEQNRYAQSTPFEREHAGELARRAEPFGITILEVDGNDVLAVHDAASRAVHAMRAGAGPHLLFCHTYRLGPHSKGDDLRDPAEIARHRRSEPLARLRARLDGDWCEAAEREIAAEVAAVAARLG